MNNLGYSLNNSLNKSAYSENSPSSMSPLDSPHQLPRPSLKDQPILADFPIQSKGMHRFSVGGPMLLKSIQRIKLDGRRADSASLFKRRISKVKIEASKQTNLASFMNSEFSLVVEALGLIQRQFQAFNEAARSAQRKYSELSGEVNSLHSKLNLPNPITSLPFF